MDARQQAASLAPASQPWPFDAFRLTVNGAVVKGIVADVRYNS
jgi:hypothetical protein